MGNRAVITTAPYSDDNVGIYLHWHGGRDSVEGFLKAARDLGYRTPESDPSYGLARLTGLICTFFGLDDDTSIGIGQCAELDCDNGDNGTYLIGGNWEIVGRKYFDGDEQQDCDVEVFAKARVAEIDAAAEAVRSLRASKRRAA